MAAFDVYKDISDAPYVVEVQNGIWRELDTRIIIPLLSCNQVRRRSARLNPTFEIDGDNYILMPQYMSAVKLVHLKKPVLSLGGFYIEITSAVDLLITGS